MLREQYGERGVKRLLVKLLKVVTGVESAGQALVLPPKLETTPDGKKKLIPRKLGPNAADAIITFQWPGYTTPTVDDVAKTVTAASNAKLSNLVDDEHCAQLLATAFQIEDVRAMLAAIAKKAADAEAAFAQQTINQAQPPQEYASTAPIEQYDIEAGIVTVNEIRASKGLGPLAVDGELTLPQFKMKYQQIYATQAVVDSAQTASELLGMAPPKSNGAGAPSQ